MTFRYARDKWVKKIIGFDAFGDFPMEGLNREDDLSFASTHDDESGGAGITKKVLSGILSGKGFSNWSYLKAMWPILCQSMQKERLWTYIIITFRYDVYEPTKSH